jgi:hypothetical protein
VANSAAAAGDAASSCGCSRAAAVLVGVFGGECPSCSSSSIMADAIDQFVCSVECRGQLLFVL